MIAHVDMDCFFVSIERQKDPSLVGKPVVVGGDPARGRSVVASASYEARRYGIRSAMPMAVAVRLCPELIVVPGDFESYDRVHEVVRQVLGEISPIIEMASIDEGYVDLSGTERLWGGSLAVAERIKWRILGETGLQCTAGVGRTKVVAKVAAAIGKPRGIVWVPQGAEGKFLAPLPVEVLPGVGEKTARALRAVGLTRVGGIAAVGEKMMTEGFGAWGATLWRMAIGGEAGGVTPVWERKSMGRETTFPSDVTDRNLLLATLHYLTARVCRRLRKEKKEARTVSVKLRYEDFETREAEETLLISDAREEAIFPVVRALMTRLLTRRVGVRLVGVTLSNLVSGWRQMGLFGEEKRRRSFARLFAVDAVRGRFGFDALLAGEGIALLRNGGTRHKSLDRHCAEPSYSLIRQSSAT